LLSQQILKAEQLSRSATRDDQLESLTERIVKGEEIVLISADVFNAWNNATRNYIEKAFGEKHRNVENFDNAEGTTSPVWSGYQWSAHYADTLQHKVAALNGYIEELKTEILIRQWDSSAGANIEREPSKKVFIVHGHDAALKYEIAHTLQNAGLDVTILHEQPHQGRTILEKFADHAGEAGFAVVLLTADDVGSAGCVSTREPLQPRARQNVVFELGFFFGLLGRGRVCAVYEMGVELPSDIHGLARVERDSAGRWKHDVVKEINAAGIPVDLSKL
jgi:predicted nucleotide-binding protein